MRAKHVLLICLVLIVVLLGKRVLSVAFGDDTIEYRGQKFRLSRKYLDYDDYKNDPSNLSPSEIPRIREMMLGQQISRRFSSSQEASRAVLELAFPGYGAGGLGETQLVNGSKIWAFSIEIPRSSAERCFTFLETTDACYLIDDFVFPGELTLLEFQVPKPNYLRYVRRGTSEILRESASLQPNKALEPATTSVTPPASARVAPSRVVAHL